MSDAEAALTRGGGKMEAYKVGDKVVYRDSFDRTQIGEIKEIREEVRNILGGIRAKVKIYVIPDAKGEWIGRHPRNIIDLYEGK